MPPNYYRTTKERILKLYTYKTSNLMKCTAFLFLHLPMPLNIADFIQYTKNVNRNYDLKHALITRHIIGKFRFRNLNSMEVTQCIFIAW